MTVKAPALLKRPGDFHACGRALWVMQAIALIVAHRTDDMSKLPPVITTEVVKKPKQAAGRSSYAPKPLAAHSAVNHRGECPISRHSARLHEWDKQCDAECV